MHVDKKSTKKPAAKKSAAKKPVSKARRVPCPVNCKKAKGPKRKQSALQKRHTTFMGVTLRRLHRENKKLPPSKQKTAPQLMVKASKMWMDSK